MVCCDEVWTEKSMALRRFNPNYLEALHYFRKMTKNLKNRKVLDYGCGGDFQKARIVSHNNHYFGVDISQEAVRRMTKNFVYAELCPEGNIGFPDDWFDVVLSFDVLEHIWNDDYYLKEARRVLRPDGVLLLSTVLHEKYWSSLDIESGHYRRYSLARLIDKLEMHGFEVEKVYFSGTFLNFFLNKYRCLRSGDKKKYFRVEKDSFQLKFLRFALPFFVVDRVFEKFGKWGFGVYVKCKKK